MRSRIVTNDGFSISVSNTVMLAVPISNFIVFEKRPIILNVTLGRNVSIDTFRNKIETAQVSDNEEKCDRRLHVKGFDNESTAIELWVQVSAQNFLRERSLIVHNLQAFCERVNVPLKKIELQG